jgi:RecG-like helicase
MPKTFPPFDPFTDLPFRYEDRRTPTPVGKFAKNCPLLTLGVPKRLNRHGKTIVITMSGIGGLFYVKFFREMSPFSRMVFDPKQSKKVFIWGAPRQELENVWCFFHPTVLNRGDIGRIVPVYRTQKGVSRKRYRQHAERTTRTLAEGLHDEVPLEVLRKRGLKSIAETLLDIHAPKEMPDDRAFIRLAYRAIFETMNRVSSCPRSPLNAGEDTLFPCPEGQLCSPPENLLSIAGEILSDMKSDRAMRLLAGDLELYETVATWVEEDIARSTKRPLPEWV